MAKLYHDLLIGGNWTFSRVGARWKEAVRALLRQDVADETITPERYEEITGEAYEGATA